MVAVVGGPAVPGGTEVLLYTTILGAIGAFVPFHAREDVDFFQHLELHMRTHAPSLVGRDHLWYRSAYQPLKVCRACPRPRPTILVGLNVGAALVTPTRARTGMRGWAALRAVQPASISHAQEHCGRAGPHTSRDRKAAGRLAQPCGAVMMFFTKKYTAFLTRTRVRFRMIYRAAALPALPASPRPIRSPTASLKLSWRVRLTEPVTVGSVALAGRRRARGGAEAAASGAPAVAELAPPLLKFRARRTVAEVAAGVGGVGVDMGVVFRDRSHGLGVRAGLDAARPTSSDGETTAAAVAVVCSGARRAGLRRGDRRGGAGVASRATPRSGSGSDSERRAAAATAWSTFQRRTVMSSEQVTSWVQDKGHGSGAGQKAGQGKGKGRVWVQDKRQGKGQGTVSHAYASPSSTRR